MARRGITTRQQQAFEALLDVEDDEPARPSKSKGSRRAAQQRGSTRVPGFHLRASPGDAKLQLTGASSAAGLAPLVELFGASLDRQLVAEVLAGCGGDVEAAGNALAALTLDPGQGQAQVQAGAAPAPGAAPAAAHTLSAGAAQAAGGSQAGEECPWSWLPQECKELVWERLPLRDRARAARTCREWAAHVRAFRASQRSLTLPTGLSYTAVRGMVAAHVGARTVVLSRWAPALRWPHEFEALLRAVALGEGDRVGGHPVEALHLTGCAAMVDADVSTLCDLLPHLREVDLSNCDKLSDQAAVILARYTAQPAGAAALREQPAGGEAAAADDGADAAPPPQPGASLQAALAGLPRKGGAGAKKARGDESEPPPASECGGSSGAPVSGGALQVVSLAGCSQLSDKGVRALLRGNGPGRSPVSVDVSHCSELTGSGFVVDPKGPLRSLRVGHCRNLKSVVIQLGPDAQLADLALPNCSQLRSLTLVAPSLVSLNLSNCVSLTSLSLQCARLRRLAASGCRALAGLARGTALPALQDLNLFGCRSLETEGIEEPLAHMAALERLNLNGCGALSRVLLPACPCLAWLDASGCGHLRQVSAASPALHTLLARACQRLLVVRLSSRVLREVDCTNCRELNALELQVSGQDGCRLVTQGCSNLPLQQVR